MTGADQIRRFATLGNHLPRHCGIATFTTHLTDALVEQLPGADGFVIAMGTQGTTEGGPENAWQRSEERLAEQAHACHQGTAAPG